MTAEPAVRHELVLAPNPGPMTLEGTNTWLLSVEGADSVVVVDPGPDDPAHLDAVVAAAGERRIGLVLLTHGHPDHSAGAPSLARTVGAPVRASDPAHRLGDDGLSGTIEWDGLVIEVMATPGHSADSVCLVLPQASAVLTGDTVLGRGTSVVAHPDGRLADYLESLQRLREHSLRSDLRTLLPGHGPALADPVAVLEHYLAHRQERLDQVRQALAAGDRDVEDVVRRVYADVDQRLWPAARMSVRAQLDYLNA